MTFDSMAGHEFSGFLGVLLLKAGIVNQTTEEWRQHEGTGENIQQVDLIFKLST